MTLFQSFRNYLYRRYPSAPVNIQPDTTIIGFTLDSLNFRYSFNDSDPSYYRLMLPRVAVPDSVHLEDLCKLACEISAKYKVGKIVRVNDDFWISYEQLFLTPEMINDEFYDMSIRILSAMIREFKDGIARLQGVRE